MLLLLPAHTSLCCAAFFCSTETLIGHDCVVIAEEFVYAHASFPWSRVGTLVCWDAPATSADSEAAAADTEPARQAQQQSRRCSKPGAAAYLANLARNGRVRAIALESQLPPALLTGEA
jgi:hypothetical protein